MPCLAFLGGIAGGCGGQIDLGSSLLWYSDHETGDLSLWAQDDEGGTFAEDEGTAFEVTSSPAHSGAFSVKLTAPGTGEDAEAALWRHLVAPPEAYYSAWFFIPSPVTVTGYWTLMRFCSDPLGLPDPRGVDLNLRSLPDGRLTLEVMHHRPEYLKLPLADPNPLVPVGNWFHLETRFLNAVDVTGRFEVWLDDRRVYTVTGRSTAESDDLYWAVANIANEFETGPVDIYVDDAAISLTRVGRDGLLTVE